MKRLFNGEAYRPTGYGIKIVYRKTIQAALYLAGRWVEVGAVLCCRFLSSTISPFVFLVRINSTSDKKHNLYAQAGMGGRLRP
ncbi:MAG: hypothetical protein LBJ00_04895 [Planctomycetaceae bacterium]|nr:hypothetical protein [Planctomycetaceae bacterium]